MQAWRGARIYDRPMEFRRIPGLPPYVFTIIDGLKVEARRNGRDVIDLGFGNPDIPSPEIAVEKLAEAARNTRNHRYSASRGIPKLREAVADLYQRRFGVTLYPESRERLRPFQAGRCAFEQGARLLEMVETVLPLDRPQHPERAPHRAR